jgi:NADH-quinone oxidoreductase subunit M
VHGLLNWILWIPFIGMVGVLFFPKKNVQAVRWFSVAITFITFVACLLLYKNFDQSISGMQPAFNVNIPWISSFNIFYKLGVE